VIKYECLSCLESGKEFMGKIKELPLEQRPYDRAVEYGVESLTDVELLAVLLRTGTKDVNVVNLAYKILEGNGEGFGINSIFHHNMDRLLSIKGIGKVKAVQILALGEFCKRAWERKNIKNRISFGSPDVVANYYKESIRHLEVEELRIVFLDTRQRPISDMVISVGTVNSSLVSVREILIESLKHLAVNVILLHNHPSGDPSPSKADIDITKNINNALNSIGIELIDHIVIGDNCYYSFKEQGII
jgi:DNA repair protein radC